MALLKSIFSDQTEPEKESFEAYTIPTKKQKIIIIGGLEAGIACATRLRRQAENAEIILFEQGAYIGAENCGLPYYIGNVIKNKKTLLSTDPLLLKARFNIDAHINHRVLSIDKINKSITIKNQETEKTFEESYDKLVLTSGSSATKPNLEGINLMGIFSLHNIADSEEIKKWIKNNRVKKAAVIGAGFIGLEMVENLCRLGIEVTLIEHDKQIMGSLDAEMTTTAMQTLSKHRVTTLLNTSVEGFSYDDSDLKIDLKDEASLITDMIIMAIGVLPESTLAKDANLLLTSEGHIIVNEQMQTSHPSIYAAGDTVAVQCVVSDKQTTLPLAGPANRQGRIAADALSNNSRNFRGVQGTTICGLFGLTMASTGLNEKTLEAKHLPYQIVFAYPNDHADYYPHAKSMQLKMLFDPENGRILGAQAVGEGNVERRIDVIAMAIQMKATVFDLEEAELCYAPQYGAAKDPVNILGMIAANIMRGAVKSVTWSEIKKSAVVLDVRDEAEITNFALPSQYQIPLNELRDRLQELPKEQILLVACAVGRRANIAVRLLNQQGFRAKLIAGGANAFIQYKLINHYQEVK